MGTLCSGYLLRLEGAQGHWLYANALFIAQNDFVFMDVAIAGEPAGRLVFEVRM